MCSFLCVITCTSATNPSALSQAHLLLLHKRHINSQEISSEKHKRGRTASRFLPLKEMKTRGAASGSLRMGFPRAKPDRARRVWTVHRPSSCIFDRPPASDLIKSLWGQ